MQAGVAITHKNVSELTVTETVQIIEAISANFERTDVNIEYVHRHDLVVLAQTSCQDSELHIAGLVLIRILHGHCSRKVYELNSLSTKACMRNCGVASAILEYVLDALPSNAYAKLYIDQNSTHDTLLNFYRKRKFHILYTNESETCMRTNSASWMLLTRGRFFCFSIMFFSVSMFSLMGLLFKIIS